MTIVDGVWRWPYQLYYLNPLSADFTIWSDTLKQFVGKLLTNCWSVFDYFVGLALKGLKIDTLSVSRAKI